MEAERRHAPRYPFIEEVEVTEIITDTKLVGKTSDLSINGVYLDMLSAAPEGAQVRVKISHKGTTFTTLGRVVFVLPNMGLGVVFTNVGDDQRAILQEWISELSRSNRN